MLQPSGLSEHLANLIMPYKLKNGWMSKHNRAISLSVEVTFWWGTQGPVISVCDSQGKMDLNVRLSKNLPDREVYFTHVWLCQGLEPQPILFICDHLRKGKCSRQTISWSLQHCSVGLDFNGWCGRNTFCKTAPLLLCVYSCLVKYHQCQCHKATFIK